MLREMPGKTRWEARQHRRGRERPTGKRGVGGGDELALHLLLGHLVADLPEDEVEDPDHRLRRLIGCRTCCGRRPVVRWSDPSNTPVGDLDCAALEQSTDNHAAT